PAQLLHPEDAPGHRARRAGRAESDVRRPRRVPLQERPILFQRLRPDREAAGRSDPDGGLVFQMFVIPAKAGTQRKRRNWVPAFAGMTILLASPTTAQDKKPP